MAEEWTLSRRGKRASVERLAKLVIPSEIDDGRTRAVEHSAGHLH